jgi:hypothetical protein
VVTRFVEALEADRTDTGLMIEHSIPLVGCDAIITAEGITALTESFSG